MIVKGRWILHNFDCVICNVYAPCDLAVKTVLWSDLLSLTSNTSDNCCFAGDFNSVRTVAERRGRVESDAGVADFNGFIKSGCLFDVPLNGSRFTWFGPGNKKSKLDHFLVSVEWVNNFNELSMRSLKSSISDHVPLLFTSDSADWGPRPFKFLNCWFLDKEFLPKVEHLWNSTLVQGSAGFCVAKLFLCTKQPQIVSLIQ
ncbi:hypothetical protein REPUB_Repub18cG0026100 [Reevesia pubescens]